MTIKKQNNKLTRSNRSYELLDYDEKWSKTFEKLKSTLSEIYGDLAVDIQHIGSTSIPGMIAKPTIDVIVLTKNMAKIKDLYLIFESRGYVCWGDFVAENEEYFTFDDKPGHRLYNVHTMQVGSMHAKSVLVFRDYMRTHDQAAKEYMDIKLKLRDMFGSDDYIRYNDEKAQLMQKLKDDSLVWAESVNHPALS